MDSSILMLLEDVTQRYIGQVLKRLQNDGRDNIILRWRVSCCMDTTELKYVTRRNKRY